MTVPETTKTDSAPYADFDARLDANDPLGGLQLLREHLQATGEYYALFEILKMQMRVELGLSATQIEEESHDPEIEAAIEKGLLEACRIVADCFFRDGRIQEGWMYMRPIGDRAIAAEALANVEVTDENQDALIEILVHEGVNVRRGYALSLERLGICNSITLFEQALTMRPRKDQQIAAGLLVERVHRELLNNLRYDIRQRQGEVSEELTLNELLQLEPGLLDDGTYHLDTSHIGSTVRFARVIDNTGHLELALDLARYGRQLHPQYQYPGEEPFLDLFPASIAFFEAILGERREANLRYFERKTLSVDKRQFGFVAVEVYVDLLARCGEYDKAIREYARLIPAGTRLMGIAPSLLDISRRGGTYEAMKEVCRNRDDLVNYAAAAMQS